MLLPTRTTYAQLTLITTLKHALVRKQELHITKMVVIDIITFSLSRFLHFRAVFVFFFTVETLWYLLCESQPEVKCSFRLCSFSKFQPLTTVQQVFLWSFPMSSTTKNICNSISEEHKNHFCIWFKGFFNICNLGSVN